MARKKALIIGINYFGKSCQLNGCINDAANVREFLVGERGFPDDGDSLVVMTDAPENEGSLLFPSFENMVNAMKWLVADSEEGDSLWLSYSGHGGQTTDTNGDSPAGYDDTICPVDFDTFGQINSSTLHEILVTPLNDKARLTILFDCCHSGSACELAYVFRPDENGNVINIADALKEGQKLVTAVQSLANGPFTVDKIRDASTLLHGITGFAKDIVSVTETTVNGDELQDDGLVEADPEWVEEVPKDVWMYSGCADDQTSADTTIGGVATGAMSWAFMAAMRQLEAPSYIEILTSTRQMLKENYSQIPQLSCAGLYDLDQSIMNHLRITCATLLILARALLLRARLLVPTAAPLDMDAANTEGSSKKDLQSQVLKLVADLLEDLVTIVKTNENRRQSRATIGETVASRLPIDLSVSRMYANTVELRAITQRIREMWLVGPLAAAAEDDGDAVDQLIHSQVAASLQRLDALQQEARSDVREPYGSFQDASGGGGGNGASQP